MAPPRPPLVSPLAHARRGATQVAFFIGALVAAYFVRSARSWLGGTAAATRAGGREGAGAGCRPGLCAGRPFEATRSRRSGRTMRGCLGDGEDRRRVSVPATFEVLVPLRPFYLPKAGSKVMKDRVIQKGTKFSAEEIIHIEEGFQGAPLFFVRPKIEHQREQQGYTSDEIEQDFGEGGWISSINLEKGSPSFKRKTLGRVRYERR
mmetsp:Transcript_13247/g.33220  ORF Transcript_13247/g.33220 Transcript_13247/m.33220 type:complete len:206 (-) Transcript_13247:59-676(-)